MDLTVITSWALGAITAILTTVFIEYIKTPKFILSINPPHDASYPEKPAKTPLQYSILTDYPVKKARYLTVKIKNKPLPLWAHWLVRSSAIDCKAEVTFSTNGDAIFNHPMPGRWVASPEPLPMIGIIEDKQFKVIDPNSFNISETISISPGTSSDLDIAAKFDDDKECYGWTTQNYHSAPLWRNPKFKLEHGAFNIEVVIYSFGLATKRQFKLINQGTFDDFRLTE